MVDGRWQDVWYDTKASQGRFVRTEAQFRNWITPDGRPGPTGEGGFPAERGRYHLYVSLACPWAHRVLIYRKLKGLEDLLPLSAVNLYMGAEGWTLSRAERDRTANHATPLRGSRARTRASGRVTIPFIWDKERRTIVSNQPTSSGCSTTRSTGHRQRLDSIRGASQEIDELNALIYPNVNNGVAARASRPRRKRTRRPPPRCSPRSTTRRAARHTALPAGPSPSRLAVLHDNSRASTPCTSATSVNRRRLSTIRTYAARADLSDAGRGQTVNVEYQGHYYGSHKTINLYLIILIGPRSTSPRRTTARACHRLHPGLDCLRSTVYLRPGWDIHASTASRQQSQEVNVWTSKICCSSTR
jgi:putative glutathione S-transferase